MEGVQSCSAMAQGGREGSTFEILVFLPISFFFLLSPFFRHSFFFLDTGKKVRRERLMVRNDIRVHKGDL
jgi:hypothetical protein